MIPFPAGRTSLLAPAALLLLLAGGCTVYVTSTPTESAEPAVSAPAKVPEQTAGTPPAPANDTTTESAPAPEEMEMETETAADPLPLREMLAAARRNMLEIQTIESLQELAGEHVGNARLLQIPGFIDEQRTSVRSYEADRDPRLKLLDDAIAYNDLLSLSAGSDMAEHRRKRAGELLDYQIAALASRLAAIRARQKLSPEEEGKRREEELALELRVLTGLSSEEINEFSGTSLATPAAPPEQADPLYITASERRSESAGFRLAPSTVHALRRLYRDDAAAEAMLAEALYRLPRRLAGHSLQETKGYAMYAIHLANALGAAFEIDLDLKHLRDAWKRIRHARLRQELHPGERKSALELIDATLAWRLAWYRLLTDLAVSPAGELPPPPEPVNESAIPGTLELLCRPGEVNGGQSAGGQAVPK